MNGADRATSGRLGATNGTRRARAPTTPAPCVEGGRGSLGRGATRRGAWYSPDDGHRRADALRGGITVVGARPTASLKWTAALPPMGGIGVGDIPRLGAPPRADACPTGVL